ncbi:MAG: Rieske (2Fe-2S) protein [Sporichthyaceae bacterium]
MSVEVQGSKLVAVADLPTSGVVVVTGTTHGPLAVGLSNGEPFAVSNRCRHLFASLGDGAVSKDGELVCPWHGARFDVSSGAMTLGPQGAFKPLAKPVKFSLGAIKLKRVPVELRDGAIHLAPRRPEG